MVDVCFGWSSRVERNVNFAWTAVAQEATTAMRKVETTWATCPAFIAAQCFREGAQWSARVDRQYGAMERFGPGDPVGRSLLGQSRNHMTVPSQVAPGIDALSQRLRRFIPLRGASDSMGARGREELGDSDMLAGPARRNAAMLVP